MKTRRKLSKNFLVKCEFISQSYTYVSWNSPLTLSLRNMRKATLDRIEAYADKGTIIRSKCDTSCLRNFFVICEFILQCYSSDLRKQFVALLSWNLQSDIWEPIGAHWGKGNIL